MSTIKNKSVSNFTVTEETTLLPFLLENIQKSRNSVKSMITRGQVSVDGHIIKKQNYMLKAGQEISLLSNEASLRLSDLNGVTIIHEDDAIIVINKEAGILSMATGRSNDWDAYRQITDYVKKADRKNRIYIVHRLDRDTSGVMIFAKSEDVKNKLQNNWQDMVKERMYTALVEGAVEKESGTITSWLKENDAMKVYSTNDKENGKKAITHYKKLKSNEEFSLVELQLDTGRKNQIRVHMQDIGHPIVGDKKYGATKNPIRRLALHATTLSFIHPLSNQLVTYTVKPPRVFARLAK